jgi:2-polyprenyl-6-methoxyphenol hydroxylase-like FAD-dependent oxidoreductase
MERSLAGTARHLEVDACVVGGGPAGMVAGALLARAGVKVVVLEKHADFLRDFRGDTIHPSTLEVLNELGWLESFLERPHDRAETLTGTFGGVPFVLADFRHLPTRCRFIAFVPQWDFLDFIADQAAAYPKFALEMNAEVTDLIRDGTNVQGVRAVTPTGPLEVRARLVIGADGRHSRVRELSGLEVRDFGVPMDVLWMRLPSRPDDPKDPVGHFAPGRIFVTINRRAYWQCGYVIPKGGIEQLRRRGIEAFRSAVAEVAPLFRDRVHELAGFEDVKLLTVAVNRLPRWHQPGLLCIGDAAHAMSPIGGVGINLAIQDAVAAANRLGPILRRGSPTSTDLAAVQKRRAFPTWVTQRIQLAVQDGVIGRVLEARTVSRPPLALRLLGRWPFLRRIPARLVGIGVRPEHVSADLRAGSPETERAAP